MLLKDNVGCSDKKAKGSEEIAFRNFVMLSMELGRKVMRVLCCI